MKKTLAAILILIMALCGCASEDVKNTESIVTESTLTVTPTLTLDSDLTSGDKVVTDMAGRDVMIPQKIASVIPMNPGDAEILYAIGAGEMIAARGEYVNYPEKVMDKISVGTGANTSVEQLIALEPQVIIMDTMAQTSEQVDMLTNAGIAVVITDADTIEEVYEAIALLGKVTGKESEADALTTDMKASFSDVRNSAEDRTADGMAERSVYFEVSPLEWGLWTAGGNTFMDEIATMCGLVNAFGNVDGWGELSEEQVISRNPDYIVTISMGYEGYDPVEEIRDRNGWQDISAVKENHVINLSSDELSRPGPRLADAASALYDYVKGE
ncbi:MAG: ABC transporter substrate-binding protein [Clostridiales bacterium]|nr:ABC transporter substrate-binding protein [Clostridiales bacterium]